MERRFTVVCEWQSTLDEYEFDCDEIQVSAKSAEIAIFRAREMWSASHGARWPHIRLEKCWILTKNRARALT